PDLEQRRLSRGEDLQLVSHPLDAAHLDPQRKSRWAEQPPVEPSRIGRTAIEAGVLGGAGVERQANVHRRVWRAAGRAGQLISKPVLVGRMSDDSRDGLSERHQVRVRGAVVGLRFETRPWLTE